MNTSVVNHAPAVQAVGVRFVGEKLCIELSDGRELRVPYRQVPWLVWLAKATPKQRNAWSLEPGGYAIYWDELDDGIEIGHLLAMEAIV